MRIATNFLFTSLILVSTISAANDSHSTSKPFNAGIGLGINYGGFGLNSEYSLNNQWGAYGALGIAGNQSGVVGLLFGTRYYLSTNKDLQPRLSASIGNFPAKLCTDYHCDYERVDIYGVGLGFRRKHIDLDISYFRSNDIEDNVDDVDGYLRRKGFISLSFGYRF